MYVAVSPPSGSVELHSHCFSFSPGKAGGDVYITEHCATPCSYCLFPTSRLFLFSWVSLISFLRAMVMRA
jgi:hypothetical protein